MKKLKFISYLFIIVGSLSMTSCSTDVEPIDPAVILNPGTDPTNPTNPTASFFKVDFNNQTYNGTLNTAFVAANTIIISGARGTQGENIAFILNGSAIGTYASEEDLMVYNPSASSEYDYGNFADPSTSNANTGSVTITEINQTTHMISGTFHFVGHWSDFTNETPPAPITFTNGSFSVPFTATNTTTDVFTAKIGGTAFNPELIGSSYISVNDQDWISIAGSNGTKDMTVSFKDGITPGTYTITGNVATDIVQGVYGEGDVDFKATSGSVTITTITANHVKGTFHFTGTNATEGTRSITDGVFDTEY